MAVNRGMQNREVERTPKSRPSSDRGLQPAHVKSESLVIADQHAAVNTFQARPKLKFDKLFFIYFPNLITIIYYHNRHNVYL